MTYLVAYQLLLDLATRVRTFANDLLSAILFLITIIRIIQSFRRSYAGVSSSESPLTIYLIVVARNGHFRFLYKREPLMLLEWLNH